MHAAKSWFGSLKKFQKQPLGPDWEESCFIKPKKTQLFHRSVAYKLSTIAGSPNLSLAPLITEIKKGMCRWTLAGETPNPGCYNVFMDGLHKPCLIRMILGTQLLYLWYSARADWIWNNVCWGFQSFWNSATPVKAKLSICRKLWLGKSSNTCQDGPYLSNDCNYIF